MKGKDTFTQSEILELKSLIRKRVAADRSAQKQIRNRMRSLGFYGRDDWDIIDCQISDLDNLKSSGRIKVK